MNERTKAALNALLEVVFMWLRFMWPMIAMLLFMVLYNIVKAVTP